MSGNSQQPQQRCRAVQATTDILAVVPDACVATSLLPLLSTRDLCALCRTCRRLRALCHAQQHLWESLTVRCSSQALLLALAPQLRPQVVRSLELYNVGDMALGVAVASVGQGLRQLCFCGCPALTDAAVSALPVVCPALEEVKLTSLSEESCDEGAGRGLLTGLKKALLRGGAGAALPLESFSSDSLTLSDICTTFAARPGAFGVLSDLEVKWGLWERDSTAALAAIAMACPALTRLRFDYQATCAGAAALRACCPLLSDITMVTTEDDQLAPALLLGPRLRYLSVEGALDTAALSRGLGQCTATLGALQLGSIDYPVGLTAALAAAIAALGSLRELTLVCPRQTAADSTAVAELARGVALEEIELDGLALTEELAGGSALSSLIVLTLRSMATMDAALARLRTGRMNTLVLDSCTGCTVDGVSALLDRAAGGLVSLFVVEMRGGLGDDIAAAALVPRLSAMPRLAVLWLGLLDATDTGALMLATACSRVEELQVNMPLMTVVGVRALLRGALRASTVGLGVCSSSIERALLDVGPAVTQVALDPTLECDVQASGLADRRPCVEILYESW
eukprot:m51a1_g5902 hypothetical protein (571) ;mRNA; f:564646-566499